MDDKLALHGVIERVYKDIILPDEGPDLLNNVHSIFVIRSASLKMFIQFVNEVIKANPQMRIYVLTHARDQKELMENFPENLVIIPYLHEGLFNVHHLQEEISYIQSLRLEKYILLMNNRYGIDYDNILDILTSFTSRDLIAYNCYSEYLHIINPRHHISSIQLIKALANWHWNNLGEVE